MTDRSTAHTSYPLLDDFEHQDEQFADAFSILHKAIADRAFPGASIAVTHGGKLIALKAFGHFTYDRIEKIGSKDKDKDIEGAPFLPSFGRSGDFPARAGAPSLPRSLRPEGNSDFEVTPATLFDLASLTKVIATTSMAMVLYERGLLDLEAPVAAIVPEFLTDSAKDARRRDITLRMMLAHSSGLPAYEKLFLRASTRDELLRLAFSTPLAADPASRAVYSDIGFFILSVALERLADESLDRFCQREIFAPLTMTNTTFNPPAEIRARIPPTANDQTFRHRIIQGEVQDENASILGGVAPHAGLFSTARDLAQFAHAILQSGECGAGAPAREKPPSQPTPGESQRAANSGHRIVRPETIALFTRREPAPPGTSRALGWDTPASSSQSGKYFSPRSFGHLGYTGTCLWIDPVRELSITLLTNRTWPDCANEAIKQVRPKFHDAIGEAMGYFA